MTKVIEISCDDYAAVYVNGKLEAFQEYCYMDLEFGLDIANKSGTPVEYKRVQYEDLDQDWYDEIIMNGDTFPDNYEDVKFAS